MQIFKYFEVIVVKIFKKLVVNEFGKKTWVPNDYIILYAIED